MTLEELSPLVAESMGMSIWLRPGGLTFSISRLAAQDQDRALRGELPLSMDYLDEATALQELVYAHEWLSYPYQRVQLYYIPSRSALIPIELYDADHASLWLEGISHQAGAKVLAEALAGEGKVVLSAWDANLLALLERIHPPLSAHPYYLPLIEELRLQSRREGGRILAISLHTRQLDVLTFSAGSLTAINHFEVCSEAGRASTSEMMYYILSMWQALGLDNRLDRLLCLAQKPADELDQLLRELAPYIDHIEVSELNVFK